MILQYLLTLVIFWWHHYGFQCRESCHLQAMRVLLRFQSGFLLFLFLLWLLWLGLPKLCWIKMVRIGTLILFLIMEDMLFDLSPWKIMVAMGSLYMALMMLSYVPSMPTFWKAFIRNECWILSKAFSVSIEMIILFFIFQYVNMMNQIAYIEESMHPWDKAHSIILLMCCWILFTGILLRIFVSMFISDIGL